MAESRYGIERLDPAILKKVLAEHAAWLEGKDGSKRADLCRADLNGANLSRARLHAAYLSEANLSRANLRKADLSRADLSGANLYGANLSEAALFAADLSGAYLSGAYLSGADLSRANLSRAKLGEANLCGASLRSAYLSEADLGRADLSGANLSGADLFNAYLSGANLSAANLSGATGLLDPAAYLAKTFEATDAGYVVYKTFGRSYAHPIAWRIEPGAEITEVVNPDRTCEAACGVNVSSLSRIRIDTDQREGQIWVCLLKWRDLPGVVVPYNTNGTIRCGRVTLVEKRIAP